MSTVLYQLFSLMFTRVETSYRTPYMPLDPGEGENDEERKLAAVFYSKNNQGPRSVVPEITSASLLHTAMRP